MGEPWPAVGEAERELATDAAAARPHGEGLRGRERGPYDLWAHEQTKDTRRRKSASRAARRG